MQTVGHHDIEQQVFDLSHSSRPGTFSLEVRELSRTLLSEGHTREELLDAYEQVVLTLREEGREEQEDDLLEVMAELEGWCAPHARI